MQTFCKNFIQTVFKQAQKCYFGFQKYNFRTSYSLINEQQISVKHLCSPPYGNICEKNERKLQKLKFF